MNPSLPRQVTCTARGQRGMTLIVSLIMLIILTMFALSTMNLSNSNLKVVGNQQAQRAVEAAAQQAIEQVLSGSNIFKTPVAQSLTINGFAVAVTAPVCQKKDVCDECTLDITKENVLPELDVYEISASTSDPVSGAAVTVVQGVRLMLNAKTCS